MEELAEKIDEYETVIADLRSMLSLKEANITGLQLEVSELDSAVNSLTAELESKNEYITQITDQMQNELHEKEDEWEANKQRLVEKYEKEMTYMRNVQLDADDRKSATLKELEALRESNRALTLETEGFRKSELSRQHEPRRVQRAVREARAAEQGEGGPHEQPVHRERERRQREAEHAEEGRVPRGVS